MSKLIYAISLISCTFPSKSHPKSTHPQMFQKKKTRKDTNREIRLRLLRKAIVNGPDFRKILWGFHDLKLSQICHNCRL